ncbi:hypothetical protein [Nonomuraea jabiensis]|uniref:Uncharacterized protein n=1 Tax=Nonomuraea jabiensis TaxID=882448 RepID=A0A7W9G4S3_9ACTN|nr:hypothetical protein [Nonomuraea jabiensis]MBB5777259.1 hypothetical protein [Nonomuraea jabiensis]
MSIVSHGNATATIAATYRIRMEAPTRARPLNLSRSARAATSPIAIDSAPAGS